LPDSLNLAKAANWRAQLVGASAGETAMKPKAAGAGWGGVLGIALACSMGCLASGCRSGPDLVGTWQGAPQTQKEVQQATRQVTKGQANTVVEGFVNAAVQGLANTFLAVRIRFKADGTAYYSGNTGALGLPPESDGPWYVIQRQKDVLTVRLGTIDHPVEARIVFRDRNKFTLFRKDAPEAPLVFTRAGD
jgi:hypothetical protein